ncbi:MAG: chemotaxis protein CheX [Chloroflexi bacterium]|nr:chemotaxis protein CheX [Chloroflexota bacterium]MCH8114222.1 chemotaxis protein CheX [Chloroflexota bacterium]MCI0775571.1 chemotaxis protein CheX [Chloroflexota bacterium]MCI0804296.1 chemotaxis protein CheX [Chloroflexota bacterium]MCI0809059.1 chemotaxis protein CheX [Chloroflexota bacterium]
MRQEFVNPFLGPAQLVWQKEFGVPLEVTDAKAVSYQYTTEDITAIIGISGKLQGNVLYGFSNSVSTEIVRRMIGEDMDAHDPMALSALGEIANVITGNAATELAANGYPCDISPPMILEPSGSTLTSTIPRQILVTFKSELGILTARIGLTENARYQEKAA